MGWKNITAMLGRQECRITGIPNHIGMRPGKFSLTWYALCHNLPTQVWHCIPCLQCSCSGTSAVEHADDSKSNYDILRKIGTITQRMIDHSILDRLPYILCCRLSPILCAARMVGVPVVSGAFSFLCLDCENMWKNKSDDCGVSVPHLKYIS